MLRLVGFFLAALVLLQLLRALLRGVPVVGWILGMPLIGFWLVAIGLSLLLSKLGSDALDRRRRAALVRQLGAVDTPHNLGKLGSLLLSQGRPRRALPYLEQAVAGEPEVAEWHYRRGCALLALRRAEEAVGAFLRALEIDDEHAYGAARMRMGQALTSMGQLDEALATFEAFERYHGPSPESAYRRGLALKALGRKQEAHAALGEVADLARSAARYQRRSGAGWALKARLARIT